MKKSIKALLAAAAVGTSVFAMAGIASAATYVPQKEVTYVKQDGTWRKTSETSTSYNKNGGITKRTIKEYDSGKLADTKKENFTYKNGKLVSAKYYTNGKLDSKITYSYKGSRLVKNTSVGGGETYVTTYSYKGNNVSKETVKLNKKAHYTMTYSYKNGRIVKQVKKYATGSTVSSAYSYDKKGRMTKSVSSSISSGYTSKTTISYSNYDKYGNFCKQIYKDSDTNGNLIRTYKYTYNKNGAMTQKVSTEKYSNGHTSEFKTVYSKFKKIK